MSFEHKFNPWPNEKTGTLKLSEFGRNLLKKYEIIKRPERTPVDIDEFIKKSNTFPIEFGTNTCRVLSQPKERFPIIAAQISSAYPVIHERVLGLYLNFLEHKIQYGNPVELKVFPQLSLTDFIQRLLAKRCVAFLGYADAYLLLDGTEGVSGFHEIGTLSEKPPLVLESTLSYDEIKLSAFLSVSTNTEFLNDGERRNLGHIEPDKSKITESGFVVGYIGPRFQMPEVMECQDILVTKTQNTKENCYGKEGKKIKNKQSDYRKLWSDFYEDEDFLYKNAKAIGSPRFFECQKAGDPKNKIYVDNNVLKKRYALSFDTLLLETEARAAAAGKQAYLHVVGIGLGAWKAVPHQEELFLETFAQRLEMLLPQLNHIDVVHFAWFKVEEWQCIKNGNFIKSSKHPKGGIQMFISRRNPAEKLPKDFEDLLLVVSFAWNSNAFPGNDFWQKCLFYSNDSSTACSTLIPELMNPLINTKWVNGENLHIATTRHGVLHVRDYCKDILKLF